MVLLLIFTFYAHWMTTTHFMSLWYSTDAPSEQMNSPTLLCHSVLFFNNIHLVNAIWHKIRERASVCAKIANSFQFPNHMAVTHSMPSLKLIFAWNYFWSLQLTGSWISANKLLWINKIDLQHVVVKGQGLYTCGALYGTPKKHVNQCCFKYFSIKLHLIPSIPFIPNEITSIPRCQAHLFIRNLKMTQPFFQRNLI